MVDCACFIWFNMNTNILACKNNVGIKKIKAIETSLFELKKRIVFYSEKNKQINSN